MAYVYPGLASWAKFNRPFGTPLEFFRSLLAPALFLTSITISQGLTKLIWPWIP
jgi:hypothetical protein